MRFKLAITIVAVLVVAGIGIVLALDAQDARFSARSATTRARRADSATLATPVLVASTATRPKSSVVAPPCDSEMAQSAAIRSLPDGVSNFGNEEALDDVMNDRAKVACLRSWAANQSSCARAGYEFWLDWYDKRIDDAEESIKTHKEERRDKLRSAEENAREQALRDYIKANKFPVPHGYRCQ